MTQLAVLNATALINASGIAEIGVNPTIEVRRESDGVLAALCSDEAGTLPLTNPVTITDPDGNFTIYVAGVRHGYSVKVTVGANVRTLHNVPIGNAAQLDAGAVGEQVTAAETVTDAQKTLSVWDRSEARTALINGYLQLSLASGALTAAVKTAAGNDPTVDDPVIVVFRDATASNGKPAVLSITAARRHRISRERRRELVAAGATPAIHRGKGGRSMISEEAARVWLACARGSQSSPGAARLK